MDDEPTPQQRWRFYDSLGVQPTASLDEIKKAYYKLALKYHPDKQTDSDSQDKFQEINRAYEVLTNPRKRDIYDKVGEEVLGMYESGYIDDQSWQIFKICLKRRYSLAIGLLLLLVFVLVVLQPILISLQVEQVINTSWYIVMIPAWLLLLSAVFLTGAYLWLRAVAFCYDRRSKKSAEAEPLFGIEGSQESQMSFGDLLASVGPLIIVVCVVLALALACYNLDQASTEWWLVFVPLFVIYAVYLIAITRASTYGQYKEKQAALALCGLRYAGFLLRQYFIAVMILIVLVLALLRLESIIGWSWFLIITPIFVIAVYHVFIDWLQSFYQSRIAASSEEKLVICCCWGWGITWRLVVWSFVITFACLAAALLDDDAGVSVPIVFIPVFVALALVFCCCFCCCFPLVCCMQWLMSSSLDHPDGVTLVASTIGQPLARLTN